jgi:arginine decarboxylase
VKISQPDIRAWTNRDSAELYNIRAWGAGYFEINDKGNVAVTPAGRPPTSAPVAGQSGPTGQIDLLELVEDLQRRGYEMPLLLRFSDILNHRVKTLCECFNTAIGEYGYKGRYRGVYPIKVNQQRHVVEELIRFGQPYNMGLEAGSKPELLVALAHLDNPDALIVCNGYKDEEYIETALLAQKLGRTPIIVVDRYAEIDLIVSTSQRLNVRPHIGIRARLATKGAGKWVESTGDRSKFGLTASELVNTVEKLRVVGMLDCLELLHFHIGSQITAIRAIKDALRESSRIFVELCAMGARLKFIDVGGGLGVDYDGSQTSFHSSTNYSLQEYANDCVAAIQAVCDEREVPHPDIVSESGRALVAHHSVLVFNVLGTGEIDADDSPQPVGEDQPEVVRNLYEAWKNLSRKNFLETYHDALQHKEEATSLFNLGFLDLGGRARVERLFWATCEKILKIIRDLEYVPEEVEGLQRRLCDTYYCNFSLFQSAPDHWAVKQLFPTMPIHRLNERPTRRAILADLTCDSDGKMDQFIDLHDVKDVLELHSFNGKPYYIGVFLVGAYQEILGDLHNLFGDTTAIHLTLDEKFGYHIDSVVEGDTVSEVLGYVQYERGELIRRVRAAAEIAVRTGKVSMEESALLLKRFEEGLTDYTYLEPPKETPVVIPAAETAAAPPVPPAVPTPAASLGPTGTNG